MKRIWRDRLTAFISGPLRSEIGYIKIQCEEFLNGIHTWSRQLSHIVERAPDGRMRQDACTSLGAGGYSAKLRFWWQI